MRIAGIDPGLTRCGIAAVDMDASGVLRPVGYGVLRTPPGRDEVDRLVEVFDGLGDWLAEIAPDAVAVERVFAHHNRGTVMHTAQVSGLAMVQARRRGLQVVTYTPSEVKAAVTGSGRADKAQVTGMIERILGLTEPVRPADAADAVALAVCHAWRGRNALRWGAAGRDAERRTAEAVDRDRVDGEVADRDRVDGEVADRDRADGGAAEPGGRMDGAAGVTEREART